MLSEILKSQATRVIDDEKKAKSRAKAKAKAKQ